MRSFTLTAFACLTILGLGSAVMAQPPGQDGPGQDGPGQGQQNQGDRGAGRQNQGGAGQGDRGQGRGQGRPEGGQRPSGAEMMRMMPLLAALDADQNGVISADEIKNAAKLLRTLDKDKNGKLSADEMRPSFGGRGQGGPPPGRSGNEMIIRIMKGDKNKDGKISKEELPTFLQRAMGRLDIDKNGVLDKDELKKMAETFGRRGGGGNRPPQGGGGGGRPDRPASE